MSFLKNFFNGVSTELEPSPVVTSFEHVNQQDLEQHLQRAHYGQFWLTDAIRPSYELKVVPTQGFRHESVQEDDSRNSSIPVLLASVSAPRLFDAFLGLLDPLGDTADVILESSHGKSDKKNRQFLYRDEIDMPVLKSILMEHEYMLLNDGCTGISIVNSQTQDEVRFDEHKLLLVYGWKLTPYEGILIDNYVDCNERIQFITEAEHVHCSTGRFSEEFGELMYELGAE